MKLYEILKGSGYSLDLFSQDAIIKFENRIVERTDQKVKLIQPYHILSHPKQRYSK